MRTASWVVRNRETKEVVCETFSERFAEGVNKKIVREMKVQKYEAIPILQYLAGLNK